MKKPKLSKEALEAYKALMKLSEEEQKLVFRKVSQPEPAENVQEPPKEKGTCPHCGSSHVSRLPKVHLCGLPQDFWPPPYGRSSTL